MQELVVVLQGGDGGRFGDAGGEGGFVAEVEAALED